MWHHICLLSGMKKLTTLIFLFVLTNVNAQPLNFTVTGGTVINCFSPTLNLCAASNYTFQVLYNWQSPAAVGAGTNFNVFAAGNVTVTANSGTLSSTQVISIVINSTPPVSSMSSTFQALTGTQTPQSVTLTAISPTVNITHFVYSPQGGTYTANAPTLVYPPGGLGTYTHCIVNDENGCTSCQQFTIAMKENNTGLTSLNDLKNTISIFPNPVSHTFYLNGIKNFSPHDPIHIQVINSIGETVLEEKTEVRTLESGINVGDLPNGIYILKLIQKAQLEVTLAKRLVISK
jgi:hypothetical protein